MERNGCVRTTDGHLSLSHEEVIGEASKCHEASTSRMTAGGDSLYFLMGTTGRREKLVGVQQRGGSEKHRSWEWRSPCIGAKCGKNL